jgi:hypothetical protein
MDPPSGAPSAREPGIRVRVVPNETLLPGPLGHHLGELTQLLIDQGAEVGVSVELDTSDRTRPGEHRTGASPIEAIALLVLAGAAGFTKRQLRRYGDRLFDLVVNWALKHRNQEAGPEPIAVTLYGPDGEAIRRVSVPQGQGAVPPEEETLGEAS